MTLDIGRSFTYMFEDESWIMKIVIGGILLCIPIVNFMALGYMLEALKRSADGVDIPLPEWDDFGGKFMKGLMLFVIGLVYTIPIWLIACALWVLMFLAGAAESDTLMSMDHRRLAGHARSLDQVRCDWGVHVRVPVRGALQLHQRQCR
jgi:hypothetical protein